MISRIIELSLSKRWVVIGIILLISIIGVWSYTLLKIEAYPDISDTNVVVITKYDGRAAEEV